MLYHGSFFLFLEKLGHRDSITSFNNLILACVNSAQLIKNVYAKKTLELSTFFVIRKSYTVMSEQPHSVFNTFLNS